MPDREPGSGDARFVGTTTGQIPVGRYILDLPSPGGTTLSLAPRRARAGPSRELTAALVQDTPEAPVERGFVERANHVLDSAEAVTDKVAHVTDMVQALLAGRVPDPDLILGELTYSLELIQRLAQSKRFAEVIKLGRPLCRLLALTLRWAALVETLRLVFHAATALADTPTIGWAQHELGTLHGSVGDVDRARALLNQARASREAIGDDEGLRATDHNLRVLSGRPTVSPSAAALVGVGVVVLIAAILVFTDTLSGGSSPGAVITSTTSSTAGSSTTTATHDSSTTSHSSSVQTESSSTTVASPPGAVPRPPAITFAVTTVGKSASMDVELVNTGASPLTVTSAQIPDSSVFTVAANTCLGQNVEAGAFCKVTIDFAPTAAGDATATLTFSDDADPSAQHVQITGTGQQSATSTTGTTTPTSSSSSTTTQPPPVQ